MSNNLEVDYNGDSRFFTADSAVTVSDLAANPSVTLDYQGSSEGLGQRPFFLAGEGRATIIRDKSMFAEHWTKGLEH